MNLTKFALRRPVTTMMVFVCLVLLGTISSRLLPLELFPEFDAPIVFIQVPYGGSTPEEVEREITRPAEEVLATISDINTISSTSSENNAQILLRFDWGVDTDVKAIEAREKLDGIREQLPDDVERIFVGQFNSSDMPILQMRISSDRDLAGAYELLNRKLKRRVERVDGVSQVELYGVNPKEVRIELKADRVAAHRVDLVELRQRLSRANFSVTAGRLTDGDRRFTVRPVGELSTIEQIQNLVVTPTGVRLRDIADVVYDDPELDHGRHLNRSYAVGMNISKESGANTVEVTEQLMAELAELENDPEMEGINLYYMNNQAEGIVSSLRDLLFSGLLGGVFAFLVLFFFLRRLSTTLIVALAVPISIMITLGFLYFLGLTLNVMSMMGLMLAIGMLVDNAVVVTESIHRHQHLRPEDREGATLKGAKEVALAVTAGTLTTAIVFLPIIVSKADQITIFLKHVAVAICVALVASLALSLTIVPLLTSRLQPPKPTSKSDMIERWTERYARILDWMLHHRKTAGLLMILLLVSGAVPGATGLMTVDFFHEDNTSRELRLFFNLNNTYTLERVENTVDEIEDYLFTNQERFEIESVYTYFTNDYAQSTIMLTPHEEAVKTVDEIEEMMRTEMPKLAEGTPSFRRGENEQGANTVQVMLSGKSSEVLASLSDDVARLLATVEGLEDVRSEAEGGDPEVRVVVDRQRARQYGFNTQQVAGTVAAALRGQNLSRFRTAEGEVDIRLQFQDHDRRSMDDLRNLPLQKPNGETVKLAALADLEVRSGPQAIQRENRATRIAVTAALDDISRPEAEKRIAAALSSYELPTGYQWGYGQRFQQEQESQNIFLMNFLMALALIYLVMAALFESFIHPLAIWLSIVFAIVGVLWFFALTGTVFSIMAAIGCLILVGVVVNNSIVLIDHVNNLRAEGMERHEAIVQAGRERMRPILMTAATTILGLIPLSIGNTQLGGDGPAYYPMARAIVGGLAFSTVITLIILPSLYLLLDNARDWSRRVKHAATR